jgi:predicted nucleic acid-binding protein
VSVPAVVVAETVRGQAHDAPVNRVLKAIGMIDDVREMTGRIAGQLLGAASSKETIDALVVATAIEAGGAVVLTGDPSDMEALAAGRGDLVVQPL